MNMFHWMILIVFLFSAGLYGTLVRRNTLGILMSVELMLNAAALNFVVMNKYIMNHSVDGAVMTLFIVAIAAAEVVVAVAIFITLLSHKNSMDIRQVNALKN